MSNVGAQQLWVAGSRFYFQRDPIASVVQPIIDFGTVQTANPTFEETSIELKDGDGGLLRLIDEKTIDIVETYEITGYNFAPEIVAMMFAASPPTDPNQSATPLTDVRHFAHEGKLLKLLDGDFDATTPGDFLLGVTSVASLVHDPDGAADAMVEGTDYEVVSAERGLIRILEGGVVSGTGEIGMTITPRAISGLRRIEPYTAISNVKGNGLLVWSMENNARQVGRFCRFSLTALSPTIQVEDYSTFQIQAKVLHDLSAAQPAGRIDYWLGDLPAAS